ncbi:MAG: CHASE domain-containing protein [Magnetococcales bacterium]|nr:CHASE domain-containing protein [Magnetococcales bacterium]
MAHHYIKSNNQRNFQWAFAEVFNLVSNGTTDYAFRLLNGVESFVNLVTPLHRDAFRDFSQHMTRLRDGLQGVAWVPYIRDRERDLFEAKARTEIPGFTVTTWENRGKKSPVESRSDYFPVYYVEPYIDNASISGADLGTNPALFEIMQRARESGKTLASGRLFLNIREPGVASIFLIKPIYRHGQPGETPAQRQENLLGFVISIYNVGEWFEHLAANLIPRGIHYEVLDESARTNEQILYFHKSRLYSQENVSSLDELENKNIISGSVKKYMYVSDRRWSFRAAMDNRIMDTDSEDEMSLAWIFFAFGLFSTLITTYNSHKKYLTSSQKERYQIYQNAINNIYLTTYKEIPLEKQLDLALEEFLTIPWLFNQSKGGIFLVEETGGSLRMVAHRGLSSELVALCARIPFGHCLCGRAALNPGKILFTAHVDEHHEITHPEMQPHGHYIVPLVSGEQLLGVMTLYLDDSHERSAEEESLLISIGNALAALIKRQESENAIKSLNQDLEKRVSERTHELHRSLVALKRTQERAIQSEKMAALGGLVAGVAHEIKTPVGSSFTSATYLNEAVHAMLKAFQNNQIKRSQLGQFLSDMEEGLRIIILNLQRAGDLVQSFKMVAVDQTSQERRQFNVYQYIQDILLSLAPRLKKTRHVIDVQCSVDLAIVSYPGVLSQILTNLINNSLLHGFESQDEGLITIQVESDGKHVLLNYSDSGKGMNEETSRKIFDPFFTTKRGQGGSGLGMHIVYNLVTQTLQGTIQCISTPGQGTTFRIQFPLKQG